MSQRVTITAEDPFGMADKNPRLVAPAVRRNIAIQASRVRAALILGFGCLLFCLLPVMGFDATLIWVVWPVAALFVPFLVFAACCERRILRFQQSRLAECERLIEKAHTPA